jgi:hypothetical protein
VSPTMPRDTAEGRVYNDLRNLAKRNGRDPAHPASATPAIVAPPKTAPVMKFLLVISAMFLPPKTMNT